MIDGDTENPVGDDTVLTAAEVERQINETIENENSMIDQPAGTTEAATPKDVIRISGDRNNIISKDSAV